jgi:ferredoxin--NADP+ reductase
MALQFIPSTVVHKRVWSEGLFTLSISCPGVNPFEAGQFLQVGLPLPNKHLHRPYSVASPHSDILDFFIVLVDEGELTPKLWKMREGDSIDVASKAVGSFTLSHVPDANCIWLIATGTGLAPYIAILREGHIWNRFEHVVLVHGVRYPSDLAYQEELHALSSQYSNRFRFVPIISRAESPGALSGRITTAIENGSLESVAGQKLSADNSVAMMCGNPQMLDDTESLLNQRKMLRHKHASPGHIVVERYW